MNRVDSMWERTKRVFGYFYYTSTQKQIIEKCIHTNENEYSKWYFHNLFIPIFLLIITAFLILFKESMMKSFLVLLNGSLSIIGISILCSMSSYLIRKKEIDDEHMNEEVVNLSNKLSGYGFLLVAIGAILYLIQTVFLPGSTIYRFVLLILIFIVLIISIKIGVTSFIIRDEFYQNTFQQEYKDADDTKSRLYEMMSQLAKEGK